MAPKARNVEGGAGSKRNRKGEAVGSSSSREPFQKFGNKVVERYGHKWFECQKEAKYLGDEHVNEVRLQTLFPVIYHTVNALGLRFMFEDQGDCNLTLVQEFYANWNTETRFNKTVPIRGKDVKFTSKVLNMFLGTPNCEVRIGGRPVTDEEMETFADRYPLTDIVAFLCGTGPAFQKPLDDDEVIADEGMDDDEEDDGVNEDANALMKMRKNSEKDVWAGVDGNPYQDSFPFVISDRRFCSHNQHNQFFSIKYPAEQEA
ncbi:hypothetical protein H5410_022448 [Solanum commersonii]|uniref:Uncharacterized protein n=1 Tax=Solanum commersonii TaxID=4109 RepID=A0A9J5ZGS7_SOLCO|nr:hypothetical protein H5410_022448 [Solanum commersonii]